MPPKQSTAPAARPRGRPPSKPSGGVSATGARRSGGAPGKTGPGRPGARNKKATAVESDNEMMDDAPEVEEEEDEGEDGEESAAQQRRRAPPPLAASRAKKPIPAARSRNDENDDEDEFDDPFDDEDAVATAAAAAEGEGREHDGGAGGADEQPRRIPPELLRRLLHEFFDKGGTRISSEANGALARYFDIFVQEAIARTMAERSGRFLEVEDLEKVAPQLLLDL